MPPTVDITLDAFLAKVRKRNTKPDGSSVDPNLERRMLHPTCQDCHETYRKKHPGKPFEIVCEGIYSHQDFVEIQQADMEAHPDEEPIPIEDIEKEDIREIYDPSWWALKHIVVKNDEGEIVPFESRTYQEEPLQCTAHHKVDRMGRGLGKTTLGVIEELHKACNKANNEILVVCPADSQSEKWYTEINFQLDNSPTLKNILLAKKQQPFRHFRLNNGSYINIFTAGSAAGRGADSIRSQSPRRIRLEEQDYLAEKDWDALGALINRYRNSEFHGSSTPTGARGKYWEMCTQLPRYREFYFPISVHPDWNEEMELNCRVEAKTEERYQHEYLAEFGDTAQGVFRNLFVDMAKVSYRDATRPSLKGYAACVYDASKFYFMGVDWNGQGTGTKIRIVEYDLSTRKVRCVDKLSVDHEGFTVYDSIEAVAMMNRKWHCTDIYIDAGYGNAQGDMLVEFGRNSPDADDKRLQFRTIIDFGANLDFNRVKPNRDPNKQPTKEELERPTKPFMVEGAVMRFEQQLVSFSDDDLLLEEQLRSYRVKTYSQHGWANTYTAPGCGDHELDAFMLALLAIEIKYGFYASQQAYRRMAQVHYASGFGVPSIDTSAESGSTQLSGLDKAKRSAGVTSRSGSGGDTAEFRMSYLSRSSAIISPAKRESRPMTGPSGVPSRTAMFRETPGSNPNQFGRRR